MGRYKQLEARVAELEATLSRIDRNMEYIRNNIQTAVQAELDNAWEAAMKNYESIMRKSDNPAES